MKLEIKIRRSFAFNQSEIRFRNPFSDAGIFITDFINTLKQTSSVSDMNLQIDIDIKNDSGIIKIPMKLFDDWEAKENYLLSAIKHTFHIIKPLYDQRKKLRKQDQCTFEIPIPQSNKVIELYKSAM